MKRKAPFRPSPSSPASVDAGVTPSHEEIAMRAEALWREKGCPQGCGAELWLEAERQFHRRPEPERETVRIALADPRLDLSRKSEDLMEELNERFAGQTGKETTSL